MKDLSVLLKAATERLSKQTVGRSNRACCLISEHRETLTKPVKLQHAHLSRQCVRLHCHTDTRTTWRVGWPCSRSGEDSCSVHEAMYRQCIMIIEHDGGFSEGVLHQVEPVLSTKRSFSHQGYPSRFLLVGATERVNVNSGSWHQSLNDLNFDQRAGKGPKGYTLRSTMTDQG